MQYHQLLELVLDASHASVMLYGPFTVRRRFVGAVGDSSLGGGGGGGGGCGFLAEAPAMKTSASMLAATTVRRTDMSPPEDGCWSPGDTSVARDWIPKAARSRDFIMHGCCTRPGLEWENPAKRRVFL